MTFDELQQLAEKDLKIDNLQLDIESLKTPALHNKWMKFHNQYTNYLHIYVQMYGAPCQSHTLNWSVNLDTTFVLENSKT